MLKSRTDSSFIDTGTWQPSVDIKEENDKFLVTADIPGVAEKDINISWMGGTCCYAPIPV